MATVGATVVIEFCKPNGQTVKRQRGKLVLSELKWVSMERKLSLLVNLQPKQVGYSSIDQSLGHLGETWKSLKWLQAAQETAWVEIPLKPPMMMATSHIGEGRLGINLSALQLHPTGERLTVQILLSDSEPETLMKLRDAINVCMARITRKPLQVLSSNTLPQANSRPSASGSKRKASSLLGSASSFQSCRTSTGLADDASSIRQKYQAEEEGPSLSTEQQNVVDHILAGKNVFFTGCAGTGKSLILRQALKSLPVNTTYVTASTGLAATAIGGTTLHAFVGIGRSTDAASAIAGCRAETRQRLCKATTLIVDEVSMIDRDFLDLVEEVVRRVRGSNAAFGGLQVVFSGDFHQLPPVNKGRTPSEDTQFCFESRAWSAAKLCCIQLQQVFRQADDTFVRILSQFRTGQPSAETFSKLKRECSRDVSRDGILATKLFTHREDVDLLNKAELQSLQGECRKFYAQDSGTCTEVLKGACPARASLELKIGAQVMLLRNLSHMQGLMNGARGIVERFIGSTNILPVVRFANGKSLTVGKERWCIMSGSKVIASRTQVPLELGWALSIHKCQGMTLDAAQVNLEKAFEPGMAYVALSRVKSMLGLQIVGNINPRALQAHPKVLRFYKELGNSSGK